MNSWHPTLWTYSFTLTVIDHRHYHRTIVFPEHETSPTTIRHRLCRAIDIPRHELKLYTVWQTPVVGFDRCRFFYLCQKNHFVLMTDRSFQYRLTDFIDPHWLSKRQLMSTTTVSKRKQKMVTKLAANAKLAAKPNPRELQSIPLLATKIQKCLQSGEYGFSDNVRYGYFGHIAHTKNLSSVTQLRWTAGRLHKFDMRRKRHTYLKRRKPRVGYALPFLFDPMNRWLVPFPSDSPNPQGYMRLYSAPRFRQWGTDRHGNRVKKDCRDHQRDIAFDSRGFRICKRPFVPCTPKNSGKIDRSASMFEFLFRHSTVPPVPEFIVLIVIFFFSMSGNVRRWWSAYMLSKCLCCPLQQPRLTNH